MAKKKAAAAKKKAVTKKKVVAKKKVAKKKVSKKVAKSGSGRNPYQKPYREKMAARGLRRTEVIVPLKADSMEVRKALEPLYKKYKVAKLK